MTALKIDVKNYPTLVFDCDGVILNSNEIKTKGFHKVASQFGDKPANRLVQYHLLNGGISRYKKFSYLFSDILGRIPQQRDIDCLAKEYSEYVFQSLLNCEIASGLNALRDKTKSSTWMIVSGGDQVELNKVFAMRGLSDMFDGGIYGSPSSKEDILGNAINENRLIKPGIFFGDSEYDYRAATSMHLDFAFVSGWTEMKGWERFCSDNKIIMLNRVTDVLLSR